jgi:hypothetical protein
VENNPLKLLVLLTVLVAINSPAIAQSPSGKPVSLRKINPDGWYVPDVKSFSVIATIELDVEGINVLKSVYSVGDPKPVVEVRKGYPCEISAVVSYSIEKELFGIAWDCVRFGVDPRFGKYYIGAMSSFLFLDSDLDGKFEIRTRFDDLMLPPALKKKYGPPPLKRPIS